jgi:hypothetical protein
MRAVLEFVSEVKHTAANGLIERST